VTLRWRSVAKRVFVVGVFELDEAGGGCALTETWRRESRTGRL